MELKKTYRMIKNVIKREYKRSGICSVFKRIFSYPLRKYDLYFGRDTLGKYENFVNEIEGKRILILGSGPSVNDLKSIPSDVKIFTCNNGLRLLINKKIKKDIDVYYLPRDAFYDYIDRGVDLRNLMNKHNKIKNLITTSDLKLTNKGKILKDSTLNNYYLKKLIYPTKLKEVLKRFNLPGGYSSGIRLIQYALYFKAKEVYLIGIDGGFGHHFWAKKGEKFKFPHAKSDRVVMEIISKKYKNIYSASKSSPITEYLKYKKLK